MSYWIPLTDRVPTTLAAALNGRHYVGYDINPEYCAIAQRRLDEAQKENADVTAGHLFEN